MSKPIAKPKFRIGTAGWSLSKQAKEFFPLDGTHLERYAQVFNSVEINSSFYREHKAETYSKWANSTPDLFKFSVKLNKVFTHEQKLVNDQSELNESLSRILQLGGKLGFLLVQLPPSLSFDPKIAEVFFAQLRKNYSGALAFEPRHASWKNSLSLLEAYDVAKVYADPEPCPWINLKPKRQAYFRLHGSPEIYRSSYSSDEMIGWKEKMLQSRAEEVWCIFDNTALFHATPNALEMKKRTNQVHALQTQDEFVIPT